MGATGKLVDQNEILIIEMFTYYILINQFH